MAQSRQIAGHRSPRAAVAALGLCMLATQAAATAVADSRVVSANVWLIRQLELAVALPTLGEWGMLAATLSLLAAGTTVILRRRRH